MYNIEELLQNYFSCSYESYTDSIDAAIEFFKKNPAKIKLYKDAFQEMLEEENRGKDYISLLSSYAVTVVYDEEEAYKILKGIYEDIFESIEIALLELDEYLIPDPLVFDQDTMNADELITAIFNENNDTKLRLDSVVLFAQSKDQRVFPILLKMLDNKNYFIRSRAVMLLVEGNYTDLKESMLTLIERDDSIDVKNFAIAYFLKNRDYSIVGKLISCTKKNDNQSFLSGISAILNEYGINALKPVFNFLDANPDCIGKFYFSFSDKPYKDQSLIADILNNHFQHAQRLLKIKIIEWASLLDVPQAKRLIEKGEKDPDNEIRRISEIYRNVHRKRFLKIVNS